MKLFKSTILAVAALAFGMAFTACEEDKFEPGAEGVGVYFPNNAPSNYNVTKATESVSFKVQRDGIEEAATYGLSIACSDNSGIFSLPTTVAFGEGQKEATVTIPCNLKDQPSNSKYTFTVDFAEGTPIFNYGSVQYRFTVTIPAAWSAWAPYDKGVCTWFYDLGFLGMSGPDPDLPISIRRNLEVAGQFQFQIEHWRKDTPLYIDYDATTKFVRIPFGTPCNQQVNVTDIGLCDLFISDAYTYMLSTGQDASKFVDKSVYDETTGFFEIFVVYYIQDPADGQYYLLNGSYGYETCQVGEFKDYSVALSYRGILTNTAQESFAVFNTTLGPDVTEAKVMISNTMSAQQIMQAIVDGNEAAVAVSPADKTVELPVFEAGDYYGVIVSFNDAGEAQNASAVKFNVVLGSEPSEWQNYATGYIEDAWFTAAWKFNTKDGATLTYKDLGWEFPVKKHKTEPGMYLLVSPWTNENWQVGPVVGNLNTNPCNIVVNVSNPQVVKIEPQASGFAHSEAPFDFTDAADNHMLYLSNMAGLYASIGKTDGEILGAGKSLTQYDPESQLLTLPGESLFGSSIEDFQGYAWTTKPEGLICLSLEAANGAPAFKAAKIRMMRNKAKAARIMSRLTKTAAFAGSHFTESRMDLKKVVRVRR